MKLEQARQILEDCDNSDTKKALEAIAIVLRHHGIADERLVSIAEQIEGVNATITLVQ